VREVAASAERIGDLIAGERAAEREVSLLNFEAPAAAPRSASYATFA
jgi:hypothetical protein